VTFLRHGANNWRTLFHHYDVSSINIIDESCHSDFSANDWRRTGDRRCIALLCWYRGASKPVSLLTAYIASWMGLISVEYTSCMVTGNIVSLAAEMANKLRLCNSNVGAAGTLTLLVKMPATVTFYRGHRRTLCCLPGIVSQIIMCIGIIFT